ncbi:LamB/YcsF family protein [Peribacillus saganii]|uniref:5-oxoprolinase subunit A n=1 Tax=Peribacillus saganii TaxID=2303992 RepID=A0A372LQV1_9BACI|nr:5-oxoprolinase subunit PxpA [Peribacillus saganii]RFU70297.1 LamB/YcsF family protein [Peribacillus saganii]
MRKIDLNCDMGESFGVYKLGIDEEVIKLITSANIACGFHAGDPNVMDRTVAMAKEYGVGIGVHMGFPDLLGFGRREMDISSEDLINYCIYQMGALQAFCDKHGVEIQHIKPHGSLGNMCVVNRRVANAVVDSIRLVLPDTKLFVIPSGEIHKAAVENGLSVVLEVFADRAYTKEGNLVSRKIPGAVIKDSAEAAEHVMRMVVENKIKTIDGELIDIEAQSVCVHGDTPGALEVIRQVRAKLEHAGVEIGPVGRWHKTELKLHDR